MPTTDENDRLKRIIAELRVKTGEDREAPLTQEEEAKLWGLVDFSVENDDRAYEREMNGIADQEILDDYWRQESRNERFVAENRARHRNRGWAPATGERRCRRLSPPPTSLPAR